MSEPDRKRKSVRTSVSIDPVDYSELQKLAERKKVTIAWVVRDAVEKYLTANEPLFNKESLDDGESSRRPK